MLRCEKCGGPMPLGYCTRPSCDPESVPANRLQAALSDLADAIKDHDTDVENPEDLEQVDLAPVFLGLEDRSLFETCPTCGAATRPSESVCRDCGGPLVITGSRTTPLRLTLLRGNRGFAGRCLPLPPGRFHLGENDHGLRVTDPARALARLTAQTGGLRVESFEGFGIHLPCEQPVELDEISSIRVGQQLLIFGRKPKGRFPDRHDDGLRDREVRPASPRLKAAPWYLHRLLSTGSVGDLVPVGRPLSVGGPEADLDLADPFCHGIEFTLNPKGPALWLHPELSGNGTWVKATEGRWIPVGSTLWIGSGIYRLEHSDG